LTAGILRVISVFLLAGIIVGCGVTQSEYDRLQNDYNALKAEYDTQIADNADTDKSATEKATEDSTPTPKPITYHSEYSHVALEGCVIIESDKLTGFCRFTTKCPVCGKTNSVYDSMYSKSGGLVYCGVCVNSQCSNWGKSFFVKIQTTSTLVED